MRDRKIQRDTIRLASRVYAAAAGVLGVTAGMGAFSLISWGQSISMVVGAVALLVLAAVAVVTLLVLAQLFDTLIDTSEELEEQTRVLRELLRRSAPESSQ